MDKPIAVVYTTTDYNKFKKLEENRTVTENRAGKLTASFGEKEIINPIIVNEKFEIIDGQGRFEALKRLNKPIKYIISFGANIEDCRRMNRYNTSWSIIDWIESYADNSNPSVAESYKNLLYCMKKNHVSLSRVESTSHIMLQSGGHSKTVTNGTLVFSKTDIEDVEDCLKKGQEILDALTFTKRPNEAFWRGTRIVIDTAGYSHERMLRNCALQRAKYNQMANLDGQLKEFSRIYNYRKCGNYLYFEDYLRNKGYSVRTYEQSFGNHRNSLEEDVSTLRKFAKQEA